jgi:hypothetical protein
MAHFKCDLDKKVCNFEIELGDSYDFFKITIIEDKVEKFSLINKSEAELLVVALNQFIEKKRKKL